MADTARELLSERFKLASEKVNVIDVPASPDDQRRISIVALDLGDNGIHYIDAGSAHGLARALENAGELAAERNIERAPRPHPAAPPTRDRSHE